MGPKARDGVMVITENARLAASLIDTHPDGKWVALRLGPIILITAYLAPRNKETDLQAFNNMRDAIVRRFDKYPVICMGDWNARMGALTGDHATVSQPHRRQWMLQWLNNPDWTRVEPIEGKWTTITRVGRGITDLVFVNRYAKDLVSNLVVHEEECIVGSDHRLLTFEIHLQPGQFKPEFQRLNIRRLLTMPKEHGKELRKGRVQVLTNLTAIEEEINNAADANEPWSWECQRAKADAAMTIVGDWLFDSARNTAGLYHFRGGNVTKRDPPEEVIAKMLEQRDAAFKAAKAAEEENLDAAERNRRWDKYQTANRILKAMQLRWRKRMYKATADQLCQNPSGDAKRIANMFHRSQRTASCLQAERLPEYADYFGTTFGAPPAGTDPVDDEALQRTDPTGYKIPLHGRALSFITEGKVRRRLRCTPRGKACGQDKVFSEVYSTQYGITTKAITLLFRIIAATMTTPTVWCEDNVALVWKNKGSREEIQYYRPISLVCRLRMD